MASGELKGHFDVAVAKDLSGKESTSAVSTGDGDGIQITCFTEDLNDVTFHFQIIRLEKQVHFFLSTQFPKQQPVLMLQSSQHFNSQGAPIMSPPLVDYPWSPRWEISQMAERIFDFLVEESLSFKKYCNETQL